jgi:hypothetical protein
LNVSQLSVTNLLVFEHLPEDFKRSDACVDPTEPLVYALNKNVG